MSTSTITVVHLVGADLSELLAGALRCRWSADGGDGAHWWIAEAGSAARLNLPAAHRLGNWSAGGPSLVERWRGGRTGLRRLRARLRGFATGPVILHSWSPQALDLALHLGPDLAVGHVVELPADSRLTARVMNAVARLRARKLVVTHSGADAARWRRAAPQVDFVTVPLIPPPSPAPAGARARLALSADDIAVLVVPPVTRESNALRGVWGALLAAQCEPKLRVLLPMGDVEADRVRYLIRAARHEHVARFVPPGWSLAEGCAAADLGLHVPIRGTTGRAGVLLATGAGIPLVTTTAAAEAAQRGDGSLSGVSVNEFGWRARAGTPRHIAAALLQAISERDTWPQRASNARRLVETLFDRRRALRLYAETYAQLSDASVRSA